MRFTLKIATIIFSAVVLFTGGDLSQAAKPFNVKLSVEQALIDNKGTDTTNIYQFTVSLQDTPAVDKTPYTIVYYFDDQPSWQWVNQTLPFSFQRNFKGLPAGNHTVKIDIEDQNNNVVGTDSVTINVITRAAAK
jgi:hypothetical protein